MNNVPHGGQVMFNVRGAQESRTALQWLSTSLNELVRIIASGDVNVVVGYLEGHPSPVAAIVLTAEDGVDENGRRYLAHGEPVAYLFDPRDHVGKDKFTGMPKGQQQATPTPADETQRKGWPFTDASNEPEATKEPELELVLAGDPDEEYFGEF